MKHVRVIALACAVLVGVLPLTPARAHAARATIYRTSHDVPHIVAHNYNDLGYGYGYAFAQDNLCEMADDFVTLRAQRSRFFGPDPIYPNYANLATPTNLQSDFFWQRVIDDDPVRAYLSRSAPIGPLPGVRAMIHGYAEGYNRYLADTGVAKLPDPRCRGAAWVGPITDHDVYLRAYQVMLLASSAALMTEIVDAAPPTPGLPFDGTAFARQESSALDAWHGEGLPNHGSPLGSNAIALGANATDNGRGMLLANPHFPWEGTERLHQFQLTIPGTLNVSGAGLFGVPGIGIGHTDHVAWSHTVSTAWRFTPYELKLVPGSPTEYIYDGQVRRMTTHPVTVQVKTASGLVARRHTFYDSQFGPMVTGVAAATTAAGPVNIFNWTPVLGYAIRDVNTNFRALNQFFAEAHAQTVQQFKRITDTYQGIPWVNTVAADSNGAAYYADHTVVPHVTDAQIQRCVDGPVGLAVLQIVGLPVLDGSTSQCEWGNDADAVVPGIYGPHALPILFRDDYTDNANNSFWLANPHQPLVGYPKIIGDIGTPRSLRTRLNLNMIEGRLHGTDGLPGTRFSLADLQQVALNNRQYAGELFQADAVAMCKTMPSPAWTVSDACDAMAAWDAHDNLDSAGAILFRRFVEHARAFSTQELYTVAFDAADPLNTPRGLNAASPRVKQALQDAVDDLRSSRIPFTAVLRDYQYRLVGDRRIPIPGGPGGNGDFNAVNAGNGFERDGWLPGEGYPDIEFGTSFIMAVQFDGTKCPIGRSLLTYSQSSNPASPFYADQTEMFSTKTWNTMPYCMRDIMRDPNLTVRRLYF